VTVQPYTEGNAPIPNGQPYTIATQRFGIVNQQDVTVVFMPRSRFLELVDECADTIEDDYGVNLLPKLRPVAERMVTFPLNTWVDDQRGCGCVVGEYLVAHEIVTREVIEPNATVLGLLGADEDGQALLAFGNLIDSLVEDDLVDHDAYRYSDNEPTAVVFLDDAHDNPDDEDN
jgi:hypothetical protein